MKFDDIALLKFLIVLAYLLFVLAVYFGVVQAYKSGQFDLLLYSLFTISGLRLTYLSYCLNREDKKWTDFSDPVVKSAGKWIVYLLVSIGGLIFQSGQRSLYHVGFICAFIFIGYQMIRMVAVFKKAETSFERLIASFLIMVSVGVMVGVGYFWFQMSGSF